MSRPVPSPGFARGRGPCRCPASLWGRSGFFGMRAKMLGRPGGRAARRAARSPPHGPAACWVVVLVGCPLAGAGSASLAAFFIRQSSPLERGRLPARPEKPTPAAPPVLLARRKSARGMPAVAAAGGRPCAFRRGVAVFCASGVASGAPPAGPRWGRPRKRGRSVFPPSPGGNGRKRP